MLPLLLNETVSGGRLLSGLPTRLSPEPFGA